MAAAALHHRWQQRPRERDRGAEVDLERAIDLLLAVLVELAAGRQARICHQDVDAGSDRFLRQSLNLVSRAQVASARPGSEVLRERVEHILATPGEPDAPPA